MTTPEDTELRKAISGLPIVDPHDTTLGEYIGCDSLDELMNLITLHTQKEERNILNALYGMYNQYCATGGHAFMGAGEDASDILERYGYIEVDGAGRVTKDNIDADGMLTNPTKGENK